MTSALFSAAVAYIIPITAVFIGFLDGEFITIWHFVGMTLILQGVYLTKGK
jgi:drug/metabolite transporter (DMT)-like permease